MGKIRCGVVGVGNCFSGLYQGLQYYREHPEKEVIGLMHQDMAGYRTQDIEFVSAFDVAKNKVGKPLHEAAMAPPNMVNWVKLGKSEVIVHESPVLDGVGKYVEEAINPIKCEPTLEVREKIKSHLKETKTEIIVSYLPVGSQKAAEFWAEICLETNTAFVNCMPVFIASDPQWERRFRERKIPVIGDDIKGQIGATIVHRVLTKLTQDRGAELDKTYQLNVGGNSVTGDQEILLVHNGKTIRTKIGEFVDGWIEMHGETRDDGKEFADLSKASQSLQCFTVDENFRVIRADVGKLIRHKLGEELYEVETQEGRKIKITKDHNVFVLNDHGELEAVPVCALSGKSLIAAPRSLHSGSQHELQVVNLAPYLKDLFAQGVDSGGNIVIHNHPEIKVPVNFPISDEVLRIVGMWLADGSFDRRGSGNMEIACGNDEECLEVIESFTTAHNVNYDVRGQAQVSVRIMSKTLANIFKLALGLSGNSYTKRVPAWVFGLSPRQIALLLQGYASGDGCVTGKQIRWTTASLGLAEDIRTLFLLVGINSSVFFENFPKEGKRSSFKTSLSGINHGIISSKEDVESFIERVGFLQSYKNKRAFEAAGLLKKSSMRVVPRIRLLKKWGIRSKTWYKNPSLRAHIVSSQLEKVKDASDLERLRNICDGDINFLRVKKVRRINPEPQYVYDLSVPGYERFICSNLLVHNTDFQNMLERSRLESKKISKTESVQSQLKNRMDEDNIHIGPSDHVPFLKNTKICFIYMEGRQWADIPYKIDLKLDVDDKANSAGIVVDALRAAKIALDRGQGGAIEPASAYLMKHPPLQMSDPQAKAALEFFIMGREQKTGK